VILVAHDDTHGGNVRRLRGTPPPHDLDAETAVLGAMLLGREPASAGVEMLTANDFYHPAHRHIFEAVANLTVADLKADPVTVADELRSIGKPLADPSILISLQVNTPSIGAVAQYGEIVARLSRDRARIRLLEEETAALKVGDYDAAGRWQAELTALEDDESSGIEPEDVGAVMDSPESVIRPELLRRADGNALLVRGSVTVVNGEPEAGKSFLMVEAVRQTVLRGERAVFIDFEGSVLTMAQRLNELRVPRAVVDEFLRYYRPNGVGPQKAAAWLATIARAVASFVPALVVIDSFAAVLVDHGLDENKTAEALVPLRRLARPLAAAGAAVVVVDHVTKDKNDRGRWGRGSGAKLGEVDAAFSLEVTRPFARDKAGSSVLRVAKDRWGVLGGQGCTAAAVAFSPDLAGKVRIELQPPGEAAPYAGPTHCMDAIVDLLERTGEEFTVNQLSSALSFRRQTIGHAAEALALDESSPVTRRRVGQSIFYRFSSLALTESEEF
jgi:hypothetical protein